MQYSGSYFRILVYILFSGSAMSHKTTQWIRAFLLLHTGVRVCTGACLGVSEGETYSIGGDAVITELLPLHHGEQCDKISMTEVQVLEATKMTVQRINELDLVPGVTIGLRVVDTCGDASRAVKLALASLVADARNCQPTLSLGFLGPGDVASASAVGRATRALHTPVVAYGPRSVLVPNTVDLIIPAPQRSAKAAVQVLGGLNVVSISIVYTNDEEGHILAEHFAAAAEDGYKCVEMMLEAGDEEGVAELLTEGPGTVVILGTREKAQSLARTLGAPGGPADLILLLDNAGPVPAAELEGIETPIIILQRAAPSVPEFVSFMERDLSSEDNPRREYVEAISNCESCQSFELGYDASVPAAMAAVLVFAEALREAQADHCGTVGGLCDGIKMLKYTEWQEKLNQASLHAAASTAFPGLLDANLDPGSDDIPHFVVIFMQNGTYGNITQVGHADESSAILGEVDELELRCGARCPCPTNLVLSPTTTSTTTTTAMPEVLPDPGHTTTGMPEVLPDPDNNTTGMPEVLPDPGNTTAPTTPPSGFSIMSGGKWWDHTGWWPKGFTMTGSQYSKMELTTYITAFTFIIIIFFASGLICIYNLQKPPRR